MTRVERDDQMNEYTLVRKEDMNVSEKETNGWNIWAKAVLTYIEDDKEWKIKYGDKVEEILRKLAVFDNELGHMAKDAGTRAGIKSGVVTGVIIGLVMLILNHFFKG